MDKAWKKSLRENSLIRNVNINDKSKKRKKIHEMIMKKVQESVQSILKQSHKHHHSGDHSHMDEAHHMEAMEDITVNECFNLSDLC
jgi:hypothetical protein